MVIRHSILWGLGMLVIYQLLVIFVGSGLEPRAEEFFKRQKEWREMELCRAQRILSTDLTGQDVYVGSSLGDFLSESYLPRPYQKLTLIGGSALTGLSMLETSNQRPQRVLIESNYALTRPPNRGVVKKVTGWRGMIVIRGMPVFRVAYRPADLFLIALFVPKVPPVPAGFDWEKRLQEFLAKPVAEDATPIDADHVRRMYELWGREIEKKPDSEHRRLLEILLRTVLTLESRGVKIVFFHMPVDTNIASGASYRRNQAVLAAHFPESRYHWIQPEPGFHYRTIDGFHLAGPSSMEFTRHLVTQLKRRD
jgi:ribosomal protein S6E (S10)